MAKSKREIVKNRCYKKWWTWALIVLAAALIFLVPKIIDWAYLCYTGEANTTFSSSDLLTYWGAIIGGVAVFLGVLFTVKHSDKKAKASELKAEKERKQRILPRLASMYKQVYDNDFIKPKDNNEYIVINPKSVDTKIQFHPTPPTWLHFEREKAGDVERLFLDLQYMRKYLCIEYTLTNIGNDSACSVDMKINQIPIPPIFTLQRSNSKVFRFVFDMQEFTEGEESEIVLIYSYTNIDSSEVYTSRECFTVFKDVDDSLSSSQSINDMLHLVLSD